MKSCKNEQERGSLMLKSVQYLERYIYLILFNTYLHLEKKNSLQRSFSTWMHQVTNTDISLVFLMQCDCDRKLHFQLCRLPQSTCPDAQMCCFDSFLRSSRSGDYSFFWKVNRVEKMITATSQMFPHYAHLKTSDIWVKNPHVVLFTLFTTSTLTLTWQVMALRSSCSFSCSRTVMLM